MSWLRAAPGRWAPVGVEVDGPVERDDGAGPVPADPGGHAGQIQRCFGAVGRHLVDHVAPQGEVLRGVLAGDRQHRQALRGRVLGQDGQCDRVVERDVDLGGFGDVGRLVGKVAADEVGGAGKDGFGVAGSGEGVEDGADAGGELVAVRGAGERGLQVASVGPQGEAVIGGLGGDLASRVDSAGFAVGEFPGVGVDEHGLPVGVVGQVGVSAMEHVPAGGVVVGVGDQERIGVGEPVPDPVEQVLGGARGTDVIEVDAGGDFDPAVPGDDDDQRFVGGEPDQVGDQFGDLAGMVHLQAGDVVVAHRGSHRVGGSDAGPAADSRQPNRLKPGAGWIGRRSPTPPAGRRRRRRSAGFGRWSEVGW